MLYISLHNTMNPYLSMLKYSIHKVHIGAGCNPTYGSSTPAMVQCEWQKLKHNIKEQIAKKKKLKQQQWETEQSIQMSEHLFEPIKFSVKRNIVSV